MPKYVLLPKMNIWIAAIKFGFALNILQIKRLSSRFIHTVSTCFVNLDELFLLAEPGDVFFFPPMTFLRDHTEKNMATLWWFTSVGNFCSQNQWPVPWCELYIMNYDVFGFLQKQDKGEINWVVIVTLNHMIFVNLSSKLVNGMLFSSIDEFRT